MKGKSGESNFYRHQASKRNKKTWRKKHKPAKGEERFLSHQTKIKIEGYKIDRLINEAISKGIAIRQLRYINDTEVTCYISPYDLKALKKAAKSLYKITSTENAGLEYKIKSFFRAPWRPAAVLLVCFLVIYQSLFVKTIEVRGYKAIPETELLQALAESGIEVGTFIPKIKWEDAREHIYDVLPQVVWLQLVHDGRKIILNISEGEVSEGIETVKDEESSRTHLVGETAKKYYCNIVATHSGYIESLDASRGLSMVEEGDYVEAGQVLILGCVPLKPTVFSEDMPTEYFVKAKGEVWANVPYRLQFNQERYKTSTSGVDEEKRADEAKVHQESGAKNQEFSAVKEGNVIANKTEKSKKEIEAKLEQQIREWAKENLPKTAEITNKELNFCYKKNIIEIGVTMEVRMQIGEEQEITIGQKNSDRSGN